MGPQGGGKGVGKSVDDNGKKTKGDYIWLVPEDTKADVIIGDDQGKTKISRTR